MGDVHVGVLKQTRDSIEVLEDVRRVGHAESQSRVRAHHREDLLQQLWKRCANISPVPVVGCDRAREARVRDPWDQQKCAREEKCTQSESMRASEKSECRE